jgi:hypothetical protein
MYRCPRATVGNSDEVSILPFFFDYRQSKGLAWPDGKGRIYQTSKMVSAFELLDSYIGRYLEKASKK